VPRSTVAAILARAGLNRLAWLTPPLAIRRYERPRPGEPVHLDIKPLARIVRVGHRIHGDRTRTHARAGDEFARVAVDDDSRVAYVEVLPGCVTCAVAPYHPQTNSKAERFIQTRLREWAYAIPYPRSAHRSRALKPWLRRYNTERPHAALASTAASDRVIRATALLQELPFLVFGSVNYVQTRNESCANWNHCRRHPRRIVPLSVIRRRRTRMVGSISMPKLRNYT